MMETAELQGETVRAAVKRLAFVTMFLTLSLTCFFIGYYCGPVLFNIGSEIL